MWLLRLKPKRYDVVDCTMGVVYLVNLKFKDRNSIDASADVHIAIHIYVCQLMGVFCDRLSYVLKQPQNGSTGKDKGRYCKKKERSFLLISLAQGIFKPYYLPMPEFPPITSLLHIGHV